MTATHPVLGGKRGMAEHLRQPHHVGRQVVRSVLPAAVMARWTREELEIAHRDLHEPNGWIDRPGVGRIREEAHR